MEWCIKCGKRPGTIDCENDTHFWYECETCHGPDELLPAYMELPIFDVVSNEIDRLIEK